MSSSKKTPKEGSAAKLSETIRAIRKAHHMTTTELAGHLGVAQSVVSRYESGERVPRAPVLLRLLNLAEGVERNPILEQLSLIRGKPISEHEALQEAESMIAEAEALRQQLDVMADPRPNLAKFAYLAPKILHSQQEIDQSLNVMLQLWLSTPEFPGKSQCFRDAARFLEIAIARAAADAPGGKHKYRVLVPVNLGDGIWRQAGDIVEISRTLADCYQDSLRYLEDDTPIERRKKRPA